MQTVNMQAQAVQNPQDDFNKKPNATKKTDAEPARNGDSFLAMVKKMIAAGKDEAAQQTEDANAKANADKNQDASEESAKKEAGLPKTDEKSEKKTDERPKVKNKSDKLSAKAKNSPKDLEQTSTTLKEDTNKQLNEEKMLNLLSKEDAEEIQIKEILPEDVEDSDKVMLFANNENLTENLDKNADSKKKKTKGNEKSDNELLASDGILAKLDKNNKAKKESELNPISKEMQAAKNPANKPNKPIISVEDMRNQLNPEMAADNTVHKAGTETRVETENSVDMVIDFRGKTNSAGLSGDGTSTQFSQGAEKSNQTFQSMLSQEIRENASDFLQAGKIVLKDNNAGEIRLQLRPENLGAVKIKLELAEGKKVMGTVTVATKEAYAAFEENLESLAKEFEENGFDTAEFNLNWQGDSSNGQEFAEDFNGFDGFAYQSDVENLRQEEKLADNLNAYSFSYGESVDILI